MTWAAYVGSNNITAYYDSTTATQTMVLTTDRGAGASYPMTFGARYTGASTSYDWGWPAAYGEFLQYNRVLSSDEIIRITRYLANRHGISIT